jgi:hypothetical protein
LEGAGYARPSSCLAEGERQSSEIPMLTKIRERAADVLFRQKLLRGEADFCTLAEAIASGTKA